MEEESRKTEEEELRKMEEEKKVEEARKNKEAEKAAQPKQVQVQVDDNDKMIKLKWEKKQSFSQEQLFEILKQYGDVDQILVSEKKKCALVSFKDILSSVSYLCSFVSFFLFFFFFFLPF